MPLHLNQRRRVQPGSVGLVPPKPRGKIQDPPRHREIAVDRARTAACTQAVSDVGLQSAVMDSMNRKVSDVHVHSSKGSCVPLETAFVLVLVQVLGGGFPKDPRLASSEEVRCPRLLDSSREDGYGFLEIDRASAFANARSEDVFVDVPDPTAPGETWRSVLSHRLLLSK